MIAGAVLSGVALVVAVVSGVEIGAAVGKPLGQVLSSPIRSTPVDVSLKLTESRYTVFELTGHESGAGGIQFTRDDAPTLTPEAVTVIGPDGRQVSTSGSGNNTETLTRDKEIFTAAVSFVVSAPGTYRVRVDTEQPTKVIIGPSLGSGFARVWGWFVVGGVAGLALVVGLTLLIVGLVLGRHPRPLAGPLLSGPQLASTTPPAPPAPPAGWYPDPREPGRLRYWNGQAWTADTR